MAIMTPVDIMMGVRNEGEHLEETLRSIAAQPLDALGTVFVALAPSDDGTAAVLEQAQRTYLRDKLVVMDNPGSWVAMGLNRCLAASRAPYIARVDGHTTVPSNFLVELSAVLERDQSVAYAGPKMRTDEGRTTKERGIARALESPYGAGPGNFRLNDRSGYVETVLLGVYRRSSLDAVGGFDEQLKRNQDDELHSRMHAAGMRIWQQATVQGVYAPRRTYRRLFLQYREYGWWKYQASVEAGTDLAAKHYVPAALVVSGVGAAASSVTRARRLGLGWVLAYLAFLGAQYRRARRETGDRAAALASSKAIAMMHLGYGLGFVSSVVGRCLRRWRDAGLLR